MTVTENGYCYRLELRAPVRGRLAAIRQDGMRAAVSMLLGSGRRRLVYSVPALGVCGGCFLKRAAAARIALSSAL